LALVVPQLFFEELLRELFKIFLAQLIISMTSLLPAKIYLVNLKSTLAKLKEYAFCLRMDKCKSKALNSWIVRVSGGRSRW